MPVMADWKPKAYTVLNGDWYSVVTLHLIKRAEWK